jgi:acyl carrier protein
MIDSDALRACLSELVAAATAGSVTGELAGDVALYDLGVDSLGWLRLIDAIELGFDVELDLTGADLRLATINTLVEHILADAGAVHSPASTVD